MPVLALHLHWQEKLRSTEPPFLLQWVQEEVLVSAVFNVTTLTCQHHDSWQWTESVKPAFLWVGNRLEYLDSFHVQSQLDLLDIKETSENAPDLLQTPSEIQGDDSLLTEGKCHEYIIEAYTSNHRGKKILFLHVNKKIHINPTYK